MVSVTDIDKFSTRLISSIGSPPCLGFLTTGANLIVTGFVDPGSKTSRIGSILNPSFVTYTKLVGTKVTIQTCGVSGSNKISPTLFSLAVSLYNTS